MYIYITIMREYIYIYILVLKALNCCQETLKRFAVLDINLQSQLRCKKLRRVR